MLYQYQRCSMKKLALFLVVILSMWWCTLWLASCRSLVKHNFTNSTVSRYQNNTKFVLYWSPFANIPDYIYGYGYKPFKNCNYTNCFATDDRSFLPLEQFDALLFHAKYNKTRHGVPWIRSPHQRYIFTNLEPPVYVCPDLKQYQSYFNWTMSYRFDSDIVRRHSYVLRQKMKYSVPSSADLKTKTDLAAWMVSHCNTSGKREELVKKMQKFTKIDVYGSCGSLRCPKKNGSSFSLPECYEMLEKKYKFYLSFENSYCKDYTTEKLYNVLKRDIVPVRYGFGDYQGINPPKSVINVEDFYDAKDLVNYLNYLDENDEEYLKYFEWKKDYRIKSSVEPSACQICEKLHAPLKESIYHDLHAWWWGNDEPTCRTEKSLPKIIINSLQ